MPMRLIDSLLETKCGAQKHDALKNMTADWTKEQCVTDAFAEFKAWNDKGYLPKDFLSVDPDGPDVHISVYKGDAAYYYEGDWIVPGLKGEGVNQEDLGFFYFPTGTDRVSFFTEQLFMTSNSKHKDEAAVFMDWISSPDAQKKYQSAWGSLSPTKDLKLAPDAGPLIIQVNDMVAKAKGIYIPADQSLPLDAVNALFRVDADIIQNVIQPKDAGAKIQAAIDNYMKTQKK
jgi:raffinose/stachyose/melibiose transport system substrate-binding protein